MDYVRDADTVRLGHLLQPLGDVYPVPKHVALLLDNISQVDANTHVDLLRTLFLGVMGAEVRLHLLGTLHGVDDRGKVHQEGIANGFDEMAAMFSHRLLDNPVMDS